MTITSEQSREPQPGSVQKRWEREELLKCGAIGTTEERYLNLEGSIHPVFRNWKGRDRYLHRELRQPLLLASRLLETTEGLSWVSDFLVDDIFAAQYPGRGSSSQGRPESIVRHHQAPWATPAMKRNWLKSASNQLYTKVADAITWQLDSEIFVQKGWVGYTCRHPRKDIPVADLNKPEIIERWDQACKQDGYPQRNLTLLLTTEYPRRMAMLPKDSEEYLLTAFMAAVTILQQLARAVYWCDFRSSSGRESEPFYGADLELDLGESFVAQLFGGWMPVPIQRARDSRKALYLESGLAWKQRLSWDHHRSRPRYRAHYSISVDHIARLFEKRNWKQNGVGSTLIQPRTLAMCKSDLSLHSSVAERCLHATAALPDFDLKEGRLVWKSEAGARFRLPQFDGFLLSDSDMPIVEDDAVKELQPPKPRKSPNFSRPRPYSTRIAAPIQKQDRGGELKKNEEPIPRTDLAKVDASSRRLKSEQTDLNLNINEMAVDDLRKRLSLLIGASLSECELLFDGLQSGSFEPVVVVR